MPSSRPNRVYEAGPGNLSARLTSFVGREPELVELERLLADTRLLTLTGPAGVGKTSLAIELARRSGRTGSDGVWFVALDVVPDTARVSDAIARTIGLFDGPDQPAGARLAGYLADRSVLLVLDNFEHVLGAAGIVPDLLRASPASRVIVTSRAALRVAGEHEFAIGPLDVGDREDGPAVRLFAERAHAVSPTWDVEPHRAVVAEICRLLDGLPLGVELAAARIAVLPVSVIRDRLTERLPLPGASARDLPARHRSLEDAVAWSYALLDPALGSLLSALSVFEGSFDLEQASRLAVDDLDGLDVLDALTRLVQQNLLVRVETPESDGLRYRMLVTIRAFGLNRLRAAGSEAVARRNHAGAFLALAEKIAPLLPSAEQRRWIGRLRLDHENLRVATGWAITAGETEMALRFVAALWRYWQLDGRIADGYALADQALRMPGADAPTKARLGAVAAAGGIAYWRADMERAASCYREQLAVAELLGDEAAAADAAFNLVFSRYIVMDLEGARVATEDAARRFTALGDDRGLARIEWIRGTLASYAGDLETSLAHFQTAARAFETTGDVVYHAMAAASLAWGYWLMGDIDAARRSLLPAISETFAMGDVAGLTIDLPACSILAVETGQPQVSALLWGAYEGLCERYGVKAPAGDAFLAIVEPPLQRARTALGDARYAEAVTRGRRLTIDEAYDMLVGPRGLMGGQRRPQALDLGSGERLTPREREVLELVAVGRTDAEIAAAFFISKKTASVHVANIKAKLGASSRIEIALAARELRAHAGKPAPE